MKKLFVLFILSSAIGLSQSTTVQSKNLIWPAGDTLSTPIFVGGLNPNGGVNYLLTVYTQPNLSDTLTFEVSDDNSNWYWLMNTDKTKYIMAIDTSIATRNYMDFKQSIGTFYLRGVRKSAFKTVADTAIARVGRL